MFIFRITSRIAHADLPADSPAQLRHAIANGGVEPGELVPSVRSLAEQLLINPNTVAKAYAELSQGWPAGCGAGQGDGGFGQRPGDGLTKGERLRRVEPIAGSAAFQRGGGG